MDRIAIEPDVCGGKPIVCGIRICGQTILKFLAAGDSKETIRRISLTGACLKFAAKLMENNCEIITLKPWLLASVSLGKK